MTFTAEGSAAIARLEGALSYRFSGGGRIRLAPWSLADCEHRLSEHVRVFVEIERAQKHPTTNVVKYWPWLEAEPARRVLLIHLFDRNAHRRELTRWLGERLEVLLCGRFRYVSADLPLDDPTLARISADLRSFAAA